RLFPRPLDLQRSGADRALHSFPTRRSSDLRHGRNRRMAAPGRGAGRTEQGRGGTRVDAIVVENIVKRFGSVEALRGVSFRVRRGDRKSTRLNSSHVKISYAVFCLKKKTERT